MAKEPEKKPDEPKPWTPDQPLEDAADEEETQRHARAEARKAHLVGQYSKPPDDVKGKKKSKLW